KRKWSAFEIEAQFGLGGNDRLFHADHTGVGFPWRSFRAGPRSLAILQSPALARSGQEHGVDLAAVQCTINAEAAATHGSSRNQHGAFARTKNFGQSENDVLGFQIAEASAVFTATSRNADGARGAVSAAADGPRTHASRVGRSAGCAATCSAIGRAARL